MRKLTALSLALLLLSIPASAQEARPASELTRAEKEAFLLNAAFLGESETAPAARRFWRVSLGDGNRKHDAMVQTSDGTNGTLPHYKLHVATYELDKLLELNMVAPSVARTVGGRPAAVTWWVDNVQMAELDRRKQKTEPPDPEGWNRQFHAVRAFDELIANSYRKMNPDLYLSTVWDNLLITRDWTIWLTDHTRTFETSKQLEHPASLTRCDRALLSALRGLNRAVLTQRLGKYLTSEQLDALDARRQLLVKHFDDLIARNGESVVLYDLPARP